MARRVLAAVLAAALLCPSTAFAASFGTSFPPAAAESWVDADKGVIVVAAGAASPARDEAAAALLAGMRESAAILVMDGGSIGNVDEADDAAIVQRAQHLPIDRIAIVRVFPGAADAPGTAVVSIYDTTGKALTGFSIREGEALAARTGPGVRGGLATSAARAVGILTEQQAAKTAEAQAEYDSRYVWFREYVELSVNSFGMAQQTGSGGVPVQGKNGRVLEDESFYEVVGQPELADRYRSRDAWKTGLTWGGVAAGIGGLALAFPAMTASSDCDVVDASCRNKGNVLLGVSIGLMSVGTLAFLVGNGMNPHPVDLDEARGLADQYNDKLKKDLGLSAAKADEPALELDAGLVAHDGGGGVAVSGRF